MAVACDNAFNNNTMIEELASDKLLGQWFDGHAARVRCFLHILNLVAKSLIRQFDTDADKEKAERTAADKQLEALARDLEEWESAAAAGTEAGPDKTKRQGQGKPQPKAKGKSSAKGKSTAKAKAKAGAKGKESGKSVDEESGDVRDDNPDDEIDALTLLDPDQRDRIEQGMRPIKLVIAKVSVHFTGSEHDSKYLPRLL